MPKKNKIEIIVVLDNIRSMHNIGSIFRTCDAIGDCSIFLCGICAQPPNKEINKTALGATQNVKWKYFQTTKKALLNLKEKNYNIISIEQASDSTELNNISVKLQKVAVVFGNEVKGISEEILKLSDKIVEIDQHGMKKSMNVSVVAGIVLWTIKNKP
tara:strand:+ start:114 stop:587 length:474 start_codon:yes stop_codon:yes gene_type:complete